MSGNGEENIDDFPHLQGVTVKELAEHIKRLQYTPSERGYIEGSGLDKEFENLEKRSTLNGMKEEFAAANMEANRTKNRYANVLPPEQTRVKLPVESDKRSDYINANYVRTNGKNVYIAAQGPLKSTVEDFWKMVWSENCDIIVMLTRLKENGRNKCHKYWPSFAKDDFGDFTVTLVSKTGGNGMKERLFKVLNKKTGEERNIHQFQYVEWPDHGLPTSTAKFREMLHKVDETHKSESPILVHCSAGIGRTGTFCAVHSTLRRLRKDDDIINLPELILRLRNDRAGMVQTREQYEFCYMAILEEVEERNKAASSSPNASSSSSSS